AASRATPGSASCLIHSQGGPPIPRTGGTIMLQGDHAHWRRKIGVRSALIAASTVGALCLPAAPAPAATGPVSPTPVPGPPTTVGGVTAKNVAAVDTTTGALVSTFKHSAGGQVETILAVHNHLLVGGFFKGINGSTADPYYASLDPATGKDDGFVHLNISGHI